MDHQVYTIKSAWNWKTLFTLFIHIPGLNVNDSAVHVNPKKKKFKEKQQQQLRLITLPFKSFILYFILFYF